jgi:putative pyruvate formate lyase activating enzyme
VGETGYCRSAFLPVVSSFCAHHGEEPPLSGTRGSGTIFFGNCTMRCVYCQNFQISQDWQLQKNNEVAISTLAGDMLYLQNELKCQNINLVTPAHFIPQIVEALCEAVPQGLTLPLVYNTSGYESLEIVKLLEGVIDIYLPDIRYADDRISKELSGAPDYVKCSRESIKEMYRQVGNLVVDEEGIAVSGLIVRHLILPERLAGTAESLKWLVNEVSPDITFSIMAQYYPVHHALDVPALNRKITLVEYEEVTGLMEQLGIENGWLQEMESPDSYRPDFEREGNPFLP